MLYFSRMDGFTLQWDFYAHERSWCDQPQNASWNLLANWVICSTIHARLIWQAVVTDSTWRHKEDTKSRLCFSTCAIIATPEEDEANLSPKGKFVYHSQQLNERSRTRCENANHSKIMYRVSRKPTRNVWLLWFRWSKFFLYI